MSIWELVFPRDREIVPRPGTPMRAENTIPRQSYTCAAAWGTERKRADAGLQMVWPVC